MVLYCSTCVSCTPVLTLCNDDRISSDTHVILKRKDNGLIPGTPHCESCFFSRGDVQTEQYWYNINIDHLVWRALPFDHKITFVDSDFPAQANDDNSRIITLV